MKKAFYCSGRAISLLKFYTQNSIQDFPVEFFVYDGEDEETFKKLCSLNQQIPVYQFNNNHINRDKSISFTKDLSNQILSLCKKHNVDYLFCLGMGILKGDLLKIYKNRIINIHPSLLPSFRGLKAIDQALETNVQILGMTAHFIDDGVDTGPIILQAVIPRYKYTGYDSVLSFTSPIIKKLFKFIDNGLLRTNTVSYDVEFKMEGKELLLTDKDI